MEPSQFAERMSQASFPHVACVVFSLSVDYLNVSISNLEAESEWQEHTKTRNRYKISEASP